NAFQQVLNIYEIQKAIDPNLPQHTENTGDKNANPQTQKASLGSTPANPVVTETLAETGTGIVRSDSPIATSTPVIATLQTFAATGPTSTQAPSDPVIIFDKTVTVT